MVTLEGAHVAPDSNLDNLGLKWPIAMNVADACTGSSRKRAMSNGAELKRTFVLDSPSLARNHKYRNHVPKNHDEIETKMKSLRARLPGQLTNRRALWARLEVSHLLCHPRKLKKDLSPDPPDPPSLRVTMKISRNRLLRNIVLSTRPSRTKMMSPNSLCHQTRKTSRRSSRH